MTDTDLTCTCEWIESGHAWVMCHEHYAALEAELAEEPRFVPALLSMLRNLYPEVTA